MRAQPGATEFLTSHVRGPGDAGAFYEACGFAYTGEIDDGEHIMRLPLPAVPLD